MKKLTKRILMMQNFKFKLHILNVRSFLRLFILSALVSNGPVHASSSVKKTASKSRTSLELVKEHELVFRELSSQDPLRIEVALRMGDLFLDAAFEADKLASSSASLLTNLRSQSLFYYQQALQQASARGPRLDPKRVLRIEYQMAKIFYDLGQDAKAVTIWEKLSAQNKLPDIKRESALKLAEQKELSSNSKDLTRSMELYRIALPEALNDETRSYIHYRLAWVEYRLGRPEQAIQTLKQALQLAHVSSIPQITQDFTLFYSQSNISAQHAMRELFQLEKKHQISGLVEMLSSHYRSNDSRDKFIQVSETLFKERPQLNVLIDAIEQSYFTREPAKVTLQVKRFHAAITEKISFSSEKAKKDSEEILLRTLVQLDGDRQTNSAFENVFKELSVGYLRAFPNSLNSEKVLNGLLHTQKNSSEKLSLLNEVMKKGVEGNLYRRLRRDLAIENKNLSLALSEVRWLKAKSDLSESEKRKNSYLEAVLAWETADPVAFSTALTFVQDTKITDELTFNVLLLIVQKFDLEKNYSALDELLTARFSKDKMKFLSEKQVAQIREIQSKAKFEGAVQNKNLLVFVDYCLAKTYGEESCSNAKKLALEQKNYSVYFDLIKRENDPLALAAEYEHYGYFGEAAALYEKHLPQREIQAWLKVGFLYHLAEQFDRRDRATMKAFQISRAQKKIQESEEKLLVQNILIMEKIPLDVLSGPFKKENLARFALATKDFGKNRVVTLLRENCEDLGPVWFNLSAQKLVQDYESQKKLSFTGKNSQKNFQTKVDRLKELDERAHCLAAGAQDSEKSQIFGSLVHAYQEFAEQILSTPLPAGLSEEVEDEIRSQISLMAEPFSKRALEIQKEAALSLDTDQKKEFLVTQRQVESEPTNAMLLPKNWKALSLRLRSEAPSATLFQEIEKEFSQHGKPEAAAYFRARSQEKREEVIQ